MNFIKAHWKTILIVLLAIMFMSKCSSSGNYERKYKKQVAYTEYAIDSMNTKYSNSAKHIDSLNKVIEIRDLEIMSLTNQLDIYKSQNDRLNEANRSLANKKVIVNIEKAETLEDKQ
jgi:septal ring factor EnvC (AmiA/AmiB activator)